MAIDFLLRGDFVVPGHLGLEMLPCAGPGARATRPPPAELVFEVASELLVITGADEEHAPRARGRVYFRVADKSQAEAALDAIVACVAVALRELDGDLALWRDEAVILRRTRGAVRVYQRHPGARSAFWSDERVRVVTGREGSRRRR